MATSRDTILVTVIVFLVGIVVLVSSAIIFILVKLKKKESISRRSVKGKKPSLKLHIRKSDLPLYKEEAPSPAYSILTENQRTEKQHATFPLQVPRTPDTPGFILQTPGYSPPILGFMQGSISDDLPLESVSPAYSRSTSIPLEFDRRRKIGDASATFLWRNAVQKATMLNVFDLSPKKLNRISVCPQGKISFSLIFNSHLNELHVRILRLIDLPLAKESGLSFPFIKIYFMIDEPKGSTKLIEVLSYPKETSCSFSTFSYSMVRRATLKFVVLEYDKISRTEFMAFSIANLADVDLDGVVESRHLEAGTEIEVKQAGLLLISLCYQPTNSTMSMVIMRASDLPTTESHNNPDYFVKITLLHKNEVMDKRRTKVAKKSVCPHFNERLSFPCKQSGLKDISFVFDVVRYESRLRQEKNQSIGNVVLGDNYSGREIEPLELYHFREMLNSPQKQISEWHRVIPLN